jgi:hypothetical protein
MKAPTPSKSDGAGADPVSEALGASPERGSALNGQGFAMTRRTEPKGTAPSSKKQLAPSRKVRDLNYAYARAESVARSASWPISSRATNSWGKKWGKNPHRLQPIPADLDLAKTA